MKYEIYIAPSVEVIDIAVEQGFANSTEKTEDGGSYGEDDFIS